jgi:chromosome segregation ATPase
MGDEIKILLEDVNEKFDLLMEGIRGVKETLDRDREENHKEHEEFKAEILSLKADVYVLKSDMVEVKADVKVLKSDMVEVKADVHVLKSDMVDVKADVTEIRKDLGDHRTSTELHQGKQRA